MGLEGGSIEAKKASAQNTGDDAIKAGIHTAEALEKAVGNNDKIEFRGALDEVVAFRASHTKEEFDQYMNSVRGKAEADDMLPQLQIFANKTEFDLMDKNSDQMVTESEKQAAKFSNPLESELIEGHKPNTWSGNISQLSLANDLTAEKDKRTERSYLRDFLQPGQNGEKSLYDRMKNADGTVNLDQATSALNVSGMLNLSQREKEVLGWLKERTDGYLSNTTSKDDLAQMCKDVNLKMDELQKTEKKNLIEPHINNAALPEKGNAPKVAGSPEKAGTTTGGTSETGKSEVLAPRVIKVEDPRLTRQREERADDSNYKSVDRPTVTGAPFIVEDPEASRAQRTELPKSNDDQLNKRNSVNKAMAEAERKLLLGGDAGKMMGSTATHQTANEINATKSEAPVEVSRVAGATKEATENGSLNSAAGRRVEAEKHNEAEKQIKEALTIKKHESYSQCAERLLALAGDKDPTGKQIRELAHQLWVADNRRKGGTLKTGQVLNIDENIRKNPNLKKIFAA